MWLHLSMWAYVKIRGFCQDVFLSSPLPLIIETTALIESEPHCLSYTRWFASPQDNLPFHFLGQVTGEHHCSQLIYMVADLALACLLSKTLLNEAFTQS